MGDEWKPIEMIAERDEIIKSLRKQVEELKDNLHLTELDADFWKEQFDNLKSERGTDA